MYRLRMGIFSRFVGLFLALFASSCAQPGINRELQQQVRDTTLQSGWRVDCTYDRFKDVNRCFAGIFGEAPNTAPLQVFYLNQRGPFIMAGRHDFPGRTPTVRVDEKKPMPTTDAKGIIEALKSGSTAYVVYHVWPKGERRSVVKISGFPEAYDLLQKKRRAPRT